MPALHRCGFVLLSMAFNLLVVVLFEATDSSLIHLNCDGHAAGRSGWWPWGGREARCSPLQRSAWGAVQVVLVALIDTCFWPVLKAAFLWFYDRRYTGKGELRRTARLVLACLAGLAALWVLASAWRHWDEAGDVLSEFVTTWPAARVTEAVRLMALWGLLVEYGMPEPPSAEYAAVARPDLAADPSAEAPLARQAGSEGSARTTGDELSSADDKRVPLLSAPH